MSLEAFLDTRLGDPVISISLNYEGLVYGTMMGKLCHYNFMSQEETVIHELSEEYIPGVWLSFENMIFAAVGDRKVVMVAPPYRTEDQQNIAYDRSHNSITCESSQVMMQEDTVILFNLDPPRELEQDLPRLASPIYSLQASTQIKKRFEGVRFPPFSVPFDFDGNKVLWMEWRSQGQRVLNSFALSPNSRIYPIAEFPNKYGKVSFARFLEDRVVFVHNFRHIKTLEVATGTEKSYLGRQRGDIVCLKVVKFQKLKFQASPNIIDRRVDQARLENSDIELEPNGENEHFKTLILSADTEGCLCIWEGEKLAEVIRVSHLPQLTPEYQSKQYFSMGYPYTINSFGSRIAVSTDFGILVIRSKYLEHLELNS